jgi:Raf kinase inhibitor-like YbhB/YbcL family protein
MVTAVAVAALGPMLAACRHDGRTLRPADPSQNATISAPSPTTTHGAVVGSPSDLASTSVALQVTAPWPPAGAIPARYTCDGDDVSPALTWSAAPAGTVEIAVTVIDDDAQDVRWVIAGLDATSTGLPEGSVPLAASQAVNSAGTVGWSGPCGPSGTTRTYTVQVSYLGQQTELGDGAAADDLLTVIRGTALATATTTGTYTRP